MSIRKVGQASILLALGTATVNLLQVLKLVIVGAWFGATTGNLDEYSVTINVLAAIQGVLLGSLQVAFIPVYVGYKAAGEHRRAERALKAVATTGVALAVIVCALLALSASPLLRLAAVGFDEKSHVANVPLFRLGLIYMFLSVACDMLTTFYNANKRYALPALTPALAMAISIVYLLAFRQQGVYALLYGLIWGNAAQLALLLVFARKAGEFRLRFTSRPFHADALPIYHMMIPMAVSLALSNLNLLVDQGVASTLGTGAVSVLYYATRLHDVLVKLFVCSVAAALLPYLAQYVADRRFQEVRSTLMLSIRAALLTLVPAAILISSFGATAVAIVLQRQEFTSGDVTAVANVWATYSIGLFFVATVFFQQRCFMARRQLTPLWIIPTFGIPMNLVFDLWLSRIWGVPGIALGTTTMYFLYMVTYGWWLHSWFRREAITAAKITPLWRPLAAIACLFAAAMVMRYFLGNAFSVYGTLETSARTHALALLAAICAICLAVYVAALKVLDVDELNLVYRFLWRKSRADK